MSVNDGIVTALYRASSERIIEAAFTECSNIECAAIRAKKNLTGLSVHRASTLVTQFFHRPERQLSPGGSDLRYHRPGLVQQR